MAKKPKDWRSGARRVGALSRNLICKGELGSQMRGYRAVGSQQIVFARMEWGGGGGGGGSEWGGVVITARLMRGYRA